MIQPLRTAHRRVFVGLALVLPALLVVGLGARPPVMRPLMSARTATTLENPIHASPVMWQRHGIESAFYRSGTGSGQVSVVLTPKDEMAEPDLLVYWASGEAQGNSLPPGAELLGAYASGRSFLLPRTAGAGRIILYSLAHQEIVDSAVVESLP